MRNPYLKGDLLTLDTLKNIEAEFTEYFVRIHRNTWVHLQYIDSLEQDKTESYTVKLRSIAQAFLVDRQQFSHLHNRMQ